MTSGRLCSFSWKQIGALSNCSGFQIAQAIKINRQWHELFLPAYSISSSNIDGLYHNVSPELFFLKLVNLLSQNLIETRVILQWFDWIKIINYYMCREIYLGFIIWDIKVPIERAISLRRRCSGQGCVCGHTLIVGQVQLQSSTCHGACRPWSVTHFFAAIASTALWLSQQGKRVVTLEKFWSIFQPEFYQGPEAQDQNRDLKFGVLDPGWLTKIEISHDPEGVRSSSLNGR